MSHPNQVKDLVAVFLSRIDLFPPNETGETLQNARREEADIVQEDRDNKDARKGGLFRGAFKLPRPPHLMQPFRDPGDGVDRCPECMWELQDGWCEQCDRSFGEAGVGYWGNSFTTFSEVDDRSEFSGRSEGPDMGDIDMEDHLNQDFLDATDILDWVDGEAEQDWDGMGPDLRGAPMLRQYLSPRRRVAQHSAAGRRRRSYPASIASSMYSDETEMMPVEEEDEDEEDTGEDSSMSGFIVDDESEQGSSRSRSTNSATPQPETSQQRRVARRVVDSDASSVATSSAQDENTANDDPADDDSDEDGPVPSGRRPRAGQSFAIRRGAALRRAPSSSVGSTRDNEGEGDVEEALENQGWSPLHYSQDGDEEDGEDSDGASTTVGWEPTTTSNDRTRNGGSLTPTADRPYLPARPVPGTARSRFPDGSRGIRRRSSVLSTSTGHYEDGEADDDDSEIDQLQASIPYTRTFPPPLVNIPSSLRPVPSVRSILARQPSTATMGTIDSDDSSDAAAQLAHRRGRRFRHPDYDPIISTIFAEHQYNMRAVNTQQPLTFNQLDDLRSATPVARPRTANRNRRSSRMNLASQAAGNGAAAVGESNPQTARMRTPAGVVAQNASIPRNPSRNERRSDLASPAIVANNGVPLASNWMQQQQARASPARAAAYLDPGIDEDEFDGVADEYGQPFVPSVRDALARPPSVMGFRATPRMMPGSPIAPRGQQIQSSFPGLNVATRTFQAPNRNPFVMGLYTRPRPSSQRLREQPSTATIRAQPSQRGLRGLQSPAATRESAPPTARNQTSQINLSGQPSRRRLQTQPSVRAIRNGGAPLDGASRQQITQSPVQPPARSPSLMTDEERQRRASELVQSRAQQLRANPFAARRLSQTGLPQAPIEDNNGASTASSSRPASEISQPQAEALRQPTITGRRPQAHVNSAPSSSIAGPPTTTSRTALTAANATAPNAAASAARPPQDPQRAAGAPHRPAHAWPRADPSTITAGSQASRAPAGSSTTQSQNQTGRRQEVQAPAGRAQPAPAGQIGTRPSTTRPSTNANPSNSGRTIRDSAGSMRA